jgi:hypothetical protein
MTREQFVSALVKAGYTQRTAEFLVSGPIGQGIMDDINADGMTLETLTEMAQSEELKFIAEEIERSYVEQDEPVTREYFHARLTSFGYPKDLQDYIWENSVVKPMTPLVASLMAQHGGSFTRKAVENMRRPEAKLLATAAYLKSGKASAEAREAVRDTFLQPFVG